MTRSNDVINILIGMQMIVHKTQMNANERKHANHKRKILQAHDDAKPKTKEMLETTRMSKDVIVCRAREAKRYRGTELVDYPSTTPVSNVPHLPGIEEGLVSSSANQSSPSDQPHASKPVGSNEPLIVPWVPTRRHSVCDRHPRHLRAFAKVSI